MKKLQLTAALAFAIVGSTGVANAATLIINAANSPDTLNNEVITNGGAINIQITNTGTATFTGALTGAEVQTNEGNNIDNDGGIATFSSAGKFADNFPGAYNVLNEQGATTTITSGVFDALTNNIEDSNGHVTISGGSFTTNGTAGAANLVSLTSNSTMILTNLGAAAGPQFSATNGSVDFLSEDNGTIDISGATGYTFSLTGTPGSFDFTGDLATGAGSFYVSNGGSATMYTYDIVSGGVIALGTPGVVPEPLPSTTLVLGALGIALLTFKARRRVKVAV